MDHTIEVVAPGAMLLARLGGPAGWEEFQVFRQELVDHPAFARGARLLMDDTALQCGDLTSDDCRLVGIEMAEITARLGGAGKVAVIVGSSFSIGIARMVTSYQEIQLRRRGIGDAAPIGIFETEAAAIEWLYPGA